MEKPKKIYLSVSYNTSATVIRAIKKEIEKIGAEVLMYIKGTRYSPDKLLSSDLVLAIPQDDIHQEEPNLPQTTYNIDVGRGQFSEANYALDANIPYFMLTEGLSKWSKLESISTSGFDDWKKNYGILHLTDKYYLRSILDARQQKRLLILT